jgi:hypothetical protein
MVCCRAPTLWLVCLSEGQDWFGVDLRLQLNMPPTDWEVYASRQRVTAALSEWQVRFMPPCPTVNQFPPRVVPALLPHDTAVGPTLFD